MHSEAKKLHLIEEILKIENVDILEEVESVLSKNKLHTEKRQSFSVFAGSLNDAEANEMEKIIENGCEIAFECII